MSYLLIEIPHQRAAEVVRMTAVEITNHAIAATMLGRGMADSRIIPVAEALAWAEQYARDDRAGGAGGHQSARVLALVKEALA